MNQVDDHWVDPDKDKARTAQDIMDDFWQLRLIWWLNDVMKIINEGGNLN